MICSEVKVWSLNTSRSLLQQDLELVSVAIHQWISALGLTGCGGLSIQDFWKNMDEHLRSFLLFCWEKLFGFFSGKNFIVKDYVNFACNTA